MDQGSTPWDEGIHETVPCEASGSGDRKVLSADPPRTSEELQMFSYARHELEAFETQGFGFMDILQDEVMEQAEGGSGSTGAVIPVLHETCRLLCQVRKRGLQLRREHRETRRRLCYAGEDTCGPEDHMKEN